MSSFTFLSKFPNVGTTIFTEMSMLAQEHNAINLSQGFPDYAVENSLLIGLKHAIDNYSHQYAPMIGLPILRQEIQQLVQKHDDVVYDADTEITITAGASEALFNSIAAIIQKDDEVIIFEPAYDLYKPVLEMFGAKVVPIQLQPPNFNIDWNIVTDAITRKTKCIIVNHPNNPTGKLLSEHDIETLAQIADKNNLCVISDEVYARIVFDPYEFSSIAKHPLLRNRSIIIASFGKLLHATGWKVGYSLAAPTITSEIRKVHQYNTFCVSPLTQYAIAKYLNNNTTSFDLGYYFKNKFQLLHNGLTQIGFNVLPTQGTYFLNVMYDGFSEMDDKSYAKWLTINAGVATIPVSAFYSSSINNNILRFCFAKQDITLTAALEKLESVLT